MYVYPKLVVVCEGESDKVIIAHLVRRVLNENNIDRNVEILPAHGVAVIPRMVRAIEARMAPPSLAVIVDSDGSPARVWSVLRNKLPWNRYSLVIADPTVAAWVREIGRPQFTRLTPVEIAQNIPLQIIARDHPEFRDFEDVALSHPG